MARIEYAADQPPSLFARWSSRIGLFCGVLLAVTLILHRLFAMPTPLALNIAASAFAGAALALAMALIAGLDIWVTGRQGAPRVIFAAVLGLSLSAVPVALWAVSREWPDLNDITTDVEHPPEFVEIAKWRIGPTNPLRYPADRFKAVQLAAYPDLKTLQIARSATETFDIVLQALGKLKMRILAETPPGQGANSSGLVEVVDKTLIMGFADDVAIRVIGDDKSSRVDVRSASRYGHSDFGRNSERVRHILKEIVGRLEASVPNTGGRRAPGTGPGTGKDGKTVKRPLVHGPGSVVGRLKQGLSRSDARREPGQTGSPPAKDEGKSPGKSRGRSDE